MLTQIKQVLLVFVQWMAPQRIAYEELDENPEQIVTEFVEQMAIKKEGD